jgi:hypothetical protein
MASLTRVQRRRIVGVATLAAVLAALISSTAAFAWYTTQNIYWSGGTRSPGQGAGSLYDHDGCWAAYGSSSAWQVPGTMTVALINANGNWVRSKQESDGGVVVFVDPNTQTEAFSYDKKAHCVNSGSTTLTPSCGRGYWAPSPGDGCA